MGQLITVTRKPSVRSDVVIFELDRSLTGMGHERYEAAKAVTGDRPPDELARRLLAKPGVEGVHIYSNVVTVDLAPGADTEALADLIRNLFIYYREGVAVAEPSSGS